MEWQDKGALKIATVAPKKKQKNFWLDQISTAGGILGGIGGSFIAPIAGTAAGAGAGSALGEAIENAIMGEDLGKNVLQEGALGAVFGAGPIKLAKGAVAGGLQLAKGAGGTVAKEAAKRAAVTPLRQMVGKGLTGAADDLAIKQFRLTPSQLASFKSKYGEDAGKVIRKYGFTSVDDVTTKGIKPLQSQFDANVGNIGVVPKQTLQDNLNTRIAKLASGKASDNKAKAQILKQEVDDMMKGFGDTIDAKELNAVRREFDSLVNYTNKAADPSKYSINKHVADGIRETLQKSDPTGTLKSIGGELSKLKQLSKNVAQQSELGRGSLPFGLGVTPGAVLGGAGAGPLGAAAGIASQLAVNSPMGRRALLKGTEKLGGKLATAANAKITPLNIAGRLGGYGMLTQTGDQPETLEDALGQSLENTATAENTIIPNTNMPISSNMPPQYSGGQENSSPFGVSSMQIGQALMQAYMAGDAPAATQLESMYELASSFEASQAEANKVATAKPLSQSQQERADLVKALGMTEDSINAGSINYGPISAPIESAKAWFNSADPETLAFKNTISGLRAAITKARAGASLTEGELKMLKMYTPSDSDSEQMVRSKLSKLRELYGYESPAGGSTLEDALMQSQSYNY